MKNLFKFMSVIFIAVLLVSAVEAKKPAPYDTSATATDYYGASYLKITVYATVEPGSSVTTNSVNYTKQATNSSFVVNTSPYTYYNNTSTKMGYWTGHGALYQVTGGTAIYTFAPVASISYSD